MKSKILLSFIRNNYTVSRLLARQPHRHITFGVNAKDNSPQANFYKKFSTSVPLNNKESESDQDAGQGNTKQSNEKRKFDWKGRDPVTLLIAVSGLGLSIVNSARSWQKDKKEEANEAKQGLEDDIKNIINKLMLFSDNDKYSRDNATEQGVNSGEIPFDEIDQILNKIIGKDANTEITKYFNSEIEVNKSKISLETILHLIYCCNTWATRGMFKIEEGDDKAQEKLQKAQEKLQAVTKCVECYLVRRGKIVNFEKLLEEKNYEKLYSVLTHNNGLDKLVTTLLYLEGRTHIYNKTYDKGEKYFEAAKFFGSKTAMFEGFLAQREGLGIINDIKMKRALDAKDYDQAKQYLEENIKLYSSLLDDSLEYTRDFNSLKGYAITPSRDNVNIIRCSKRVINNWSNLIGLSGDNEIAKQVINGILTPNSDSISYLDILEDQSVLALSQKEKASAYNALGNMIIKLEKSRANLDEPSINLNKLIEHDKSCNILSLAEKLFEKAENLSLSDDSDKKVARAGLIKVKVLILGNSKEDMTSEKTLKLIEEIVNLTKLTSQFTGDKWSPTNDKICFTLKDSFNNCSNLDTAEIQKYTDLIGSICYDD